MRQHPEPDELYLRIGLMAQRLALDAVFVDPNEM